MPIHADHFIKGEWKAGSGQAFTSRNPATLEVVWQGHAAEQSEIDDAVSAARRAHEGWADLPLEKRIGYLERFREALNHSNDQLVDAICRETGKPLWESKGEVAAMVNKVGISIEAYQERCPTMTRPHPGGLSITRHKSHGVVAVFGPFNFPGHLPNGHIVPALLAGNTVVFKPSELAPLVADVTMKVWEEIGLPEGVLNLRLKADVIPDACL